MSDILLINHLNITGEVFKLDVKNKTIHVVFVYQQKGKGEWKHWNDFIKNSQVSMTRKVQEILVPTMDTVRYSYLMDHALKNDR